MEYLSTDTSNPFFYGYMCSQEQQGVNGIVRQIVEECGTRIKASELTKKLEEKGLDINNLTPSELNLIDGTFDCWE